MVIGITLPKDIAHQIITSSVLEVSTQLSKAPSRGREATRMSV